MAVITFTEDLVARVYPGDLDEAYNVTIAPSGLLAGHALRQVILDGSYDFTTALASGTAGFRGIALETQVASGTISLLRRGVLFGYNLDAMNYDAPVYLSDTVGMLDTVPGTITVIVGRVISVNDPPRTRALYIDAEYAQTFDLG